MLMCLRNQPCHFLMIEDDPAIVGQVEMLADEFLEDGMVFRVAKSLGDAIDVLKDKRSPAFEVIVIDPGLPDSEGIDTVYAVAALEPEIPRMVYTGFADKKFIDLAFSSGAEEVLFKGEWTVMGMATLLHYAAGQWRALRRERDRCTKAEATAEHLQAIIDEAVTVGVDKGVMGRLGESLREIRSIAAARVA